MASTTVTVRQNRDRTITVRAAGTVEHISTEAKSKAQVFDQVKYAIFSAGQYIGDADLTELLYEVTHT